MRFRLLLNLRSGGFALLVFPVSWSITSVRIRATIVSPATTSVAVVPVVAPSIGISNISIAVTRNQL
jgi:hypothetical protein